MIKSNFNFDVHSIIINGNLGDLSSIHQDK